MNLLVPVKRVVDFTVRPQVTVFVAAAAMLCGASPAAAQDVAPQNLTQARRHVDFPACGFTLANGVRIEFAGLHAIERGRRVFHKLVVFGVPRVRPAQIGIGLKPTPVGMTVSVAGVTPRFDGRVVRSDQAATYFEFSYPVLEVFSRGGGMDVVSVIRRRLGPVIARVGFPDDGRQARGLIARGQSCYQNALDAD